MMPHPGFLSLADSGSVEGSGETVRRRLTEVSKEIEGHGIDHLLAILDVTTNVTLADQN